MKTKPLIEEMKEAITKVLKPIVISRLPRSFSNSFKLSENSLLINQDETGEYSFEVEYNSTEKASSVLRRHHITICVVTSSGVPQETYIMELHDSIEGNVVLQEVMKSSEELIVTYYKWLALEFDKLT